MRVGLGRLGVAAGVAQRVGEVEPGPHIARFAVDGALEQGDIAGEFVHPIGPAGVVEEPDIAERLDIALDVEILVGHAPVARRHIAPEQPGVPVADASGVLQHPVGGGVEPFTEVGGADAQFHVGVGEQQKIEIQRG